MGDVAYDSEIHVASVFRVEVYNNPGTELTSIINHRENLKSVMINFQKI
jgi:hypothetical protein